MITSNNLEIGALFEYTSPIHDDNLRLVIIYDESKEKEPYDINSFQLLDIDRLSIFDTFKELCCDLLTFLNSKKIRMVCKCIWLDPVVTI